uniref:Glycosyltransferase n=1 Tax=Sesuvium portulacastrum TaxID=221166 RepID=A0A2I7ZAV4_SESPO|nr:glycosyltransferase [Sesuvium portulacastrum]
MKYQVILSRSFSQYEQKHFGYGLIIGSFVIVWSICTVFFHYSDPLTVLNLQQLNGTIEEAAHGTALVSVPKFVDIPTYPIESKNNVKAETKGVKKNNLNNNYAVDNVKEDIKQMADQINTRLSCNTSEPRLSYCKIEGRNIMIQGNSSTIFIPAGSCSKLEKQYLWSITPYVRKDSIALTQRVKKWHVNSTSGFPACSQNSNIPAILFSIGGYSGNTFHDFSDIIVPLYLTSKKFNGEVKFLLSDYKPWWVSKFSVILKHLSNYQVININIDQEVRCYEQLIIGLEFHKELSIDSQRTTDNGGDLMSMKDFKAFLRGAFSLNRTSAIKVHKHNHSHGLRPRLVIISRKWSRSFTNQDEIVKMATTVGYNVILAEARLSTNLSEFAGLLNSGDVLMGVHGAGLTNMVFLPEDAVVIQIIPFGNIDGLARKCFKNPAKDMNIRYLEYKIRVEESSLIHQYPRNHSILRDPSSIHRHGWDAVKSTYLDKQNVRLDVKRFRVVLLTALKLLH